MPSLHRGRVAAMGAQDALTYTRLRAESRLPMRLALELLAFIFVASVLPALLADWHDRHTLRKQAIGTARTQKEAEK